MNHFIFFCVVTLALTQTIYSQSNIADCGVSEGLADLLTITNELHDTAKPADVPIEKINSKPKWGYEGEMGDAFWGHLDTAFETCKKGLQQSPISIPTTSQYLPGILDVHWSPLQPPVAVSHLGSVFQVTVESNIAAQDNYLVFNGAKYSLLQFHFHGPSEHRTNGTYYPLEMHAVHRNAEGKLLVVGIFLDYSTTPNTFFEELLPNFPRVKSNEYLPTALDWEPLIKALNFDRLWLYDGSLTTPPCSEGVQWVVVDSVVGVSAKFIATHTSSIGFNSRHTQPLNGRLHPQTFSVTSHSDHEDCSIHQH